MSEQVSESWEQSHDSDGTAEHEPVIIRDKRRIDPDGDTAKPEFIGDPNEVKQGEEVEVSDSPINEELMSAQQEAAERTSDLQRLQAEFANYRKRVDRDRVVVSELAQAKVVMLLLPVLDDIDRARQHGDLEGPFKVVADQIASVLDKLAVVPFGEVGDPFDPEQHEAVMHSQSSEVTVATCTTVLRPGYKQGDRLLRPAMVGVTDPE